MSDVNDDDDDDEKKIPSKYELKHEHVSQTRWVVI